jgi:ABC-type branched-subunit amino acid transport system ATPase component
LVIVEHVFNMPRILRIAHTVWTLSDGKVQTEDVARFADKRSSEFDNVLENLLRQFARPGSRIEEQLLYGGATFIRITSAKEKTELEVPVLDVRSLLVYRGPHLVIGKEDAIGETEGLSLSLYQGDVGILCAPNGWGKTTLLQALMGILPISHGQLFLHGEDLSTLPTWERARKGLRLITARNSLFPSLTVREYFSLSRPSSDSERAKQSNLERSIGQLSGGERQILSLENLFVPEVMNLLDEPFLGLDAGAAKQAGEQLSHSVDSLKGTLLIAIPATTDHEKHPLFVQSKLENNKRRES